MSVLRPLTIYELRSRGEDHLAAVRNTADIDKFCSSLDWMLPAYEAFTPTHALYLRYSDSGFISLSRGFNRRIGRYLQPLEAAWCLACPVVGHDIGALANEFAEDLADAPVDWDLLYLAGVPTSSAVFDALVDAFGARHRLRLGHNTRRFIASLEGGPDGFLRRRSPKFRSNLRRAVRQADGAGFTYEYLSEFPTEEAALETYDRVLRVEEGSWKGLAGTGILDGSMHAFYRAMVPRLARRGGFRVLFAQHEGRDVAFVFGAVLDGTYRGLQLSYVDTYASYSLGNLVQLKMIEALCEEGQTRYDLGSELEYKARWAEDVHESVALWIWRT